MIDHGQQTEETLSYFLLNLGFIQTFVSFLTNISPGLINYSLIGYNYECTFYGSVDFISLSYLYL